MNPFLLFLLAVLSPLLLATTLLVLPYVGIVAAAYIIYDKGEKIHPLHDKLDDVFFMIDIYGNLFKQWSAHIAEADLLTYTLPLIVLPFVSIALALWFTAMLARKLKDIFQSGVSH